MSLSRRKTIECRHCHKEGEFNLWTSVDGDLDPELREKIFSEELFMYHCPHCGKVTGIPSGMLYKDMKHRFMLLFDFFKPDDYDYMPMELPEDLMMYKDYTFRTVFDLQRFKEKIIILEHDIDDVAVERQKYMISHFIMPEIAEKGYKLFFARLEMPDEEFPHGKIFFCYNDEEKQQTMEVRFAMDSYYEHKLACELDPRMTVKAFMCVDEEWLAKQLKEE